MWVNGLRMGTKKKAPSSPLLASIMVANDLDHSLLYTFNYDVWEKILTKGEA